MGRARAAGRPGALTEAIQTIVAKSVAGISERFAAIEGEAKRLSKEVEALRSGREDERRSVSLDDVDRAVKLAVAALEETLPERVDGILAAQLSTPMEAVLTLPNAVPPRKVCRRARSAAADGGAGKAHKKYSLKRCPVEGCGALVRCTDYGADPRKYSCKVHGEVVPA